MARRYEALLDSKLLDEISQLLDKLVSPPLHLRARRAQINIPAIPIRTLRIRSRVISIHKLEHMRPMECQLARRRWATEGARRP